jgi:hypothetical protein
MKSVGVDAWLGHWLKLQKKNKRPLVLKDLSDRSSDRNINPTSVSKKKGKSSKGPYVDDVSEEEHLNNDDETEQEVNDGSDDTNDAQMDGNTVGMDGNNADSTNTKDLPPPPKSAGNSRTSRRAFLASLSDDANYKNLRLLLRATEVCITLSLVTFSDSFPEWGLVGSRSTVMGIVEI